MGFLLLLQKNLLISFRTPIWTIFEVIVPLVVAIACCVMMFEAPDLSHYGYLDCALRGNSKYDHGISDGSNTEWAVIAKNLTNDMINIFNSTCKRPDYGSPRVDEYYHSRRAENYMNDTQDRRSEDFEEQLSEALSQHVTNDKRPKEMCATNMCTYKKPTICTRWNYYETWEDFKNAHKQDVSSMNAIKINALSLEKGQLDYEFIKVRDPFFRNTLDALSEYSIEVLLSSNALVYRSPFREYHMLMELESRVLNKNADFEHHLPEIKECWTSGRRIEWNTPLCIFPIFVYVLLLPLLMNTANNIATEIESGVWEFLLVMGERPISLWLSHYVYAVLKMLPLLIALPLGVDFTVESAGVTILTVWAVAFIGLYSVALALCIGSFMGKSTSAIKVALFVWAGSLLPMALTFNVYEPNAATYLADLIPIANANHAFSLVNAYAIRGRSFISGAMHDLLPMQQVIGMSVVCLVYIHLLLIALANAKILSRLSFKGLFRKVVKPNVDVDHIVHNSWREEPKTSETALVADVEVKDVVKVWENTGEMAVRGLSLTAYRGQVTVLLGHNGAGKSTTYSMISGITQPTAGTISITGHDIVRETTACRAAMGFCMQANCLFPKLTTRDHLWFYHKLKNGEGPWKEAADRLSEELDMASYEKRRSVNLSGGQKRKLSVALALIGDSKVILLDEPTAGMDPASRRAMEKIIHIEKQNRTIMLTTHYMDEAEAMGDRILIMHAGHVVASGTAMFLKKRFGCAYVLSVVMRSRQPEKQDRVTETVQELVTISEKTVKAKQIDYDINVAEQKRLPDLLEKLEATQEELEIESFGLNLNTLEDVFVKVGEIVEKEAGHELKHEDDPTEYTAAGSFLRQLLILLALFAKKLFCMASLSTLIVQILVPLSIAYLLFVQYPSAASDGTSVDITMDLLKKFVFTMASNGSESEVMENSIASYVRDRGLIVQNNEYGIEQTFPWTIAGYCGKQRYYFFPSYSSTAGLAIAQMLVEQEYGPIGGKIRARFVYLQDSVDHSQMLALLFGMLFILPLITSPQVGQPIIERITKFKHQQFMAGVGVIRYWLTIFLMDYAAYALIGVAILLMDYFGSDSPVGYKVWFFLLMYAPPTLLFSYLLSFAFDSPTKAAVLLLVGQFISTFVTIMIGLKVVKESQGAEREWGPHFFIIPLTGFMIGLLNDKQRIWTDSTENYAAAMMLAETVLFALLLLLKESQIVGGIVRMRPQWDGELVNDEDVRNEAAYIDTNPLGLALKVDKLTKYYSKLCALKSTSYGMQRGEVFGLLGESGAGKTTTFQILTAEQLPSSGTATINDRPIQRSSRIGYVPQFDAVMPSFSCRQNMFVLGGIIGYKRLCARYKSMLNVVGLSEHAGKNASSLSGGQRRRLSIGIALMTTSDLIIMDEPTAGVDPMARRDIWKAMEIAKKAGKGIMLSSHSMEECEALCDRVAVLCQGRLVAINSCQQLKSKHSLVFVLVVVIDAKNRFEQVVGAIQAAFPDAIRQNKEFVALTIKWHVPRNPDSKWSKLFREIQKIAEDLQLKEYCLSQSTLEDTFLALNRKYYVPEEHEKAKKEEEPKEGAETQDSAGSQGGATKEDNASQGGAQAKDATSKDAPSQETTTQEAAPATNDKDTQRTRTQGSPTKGSTSRDSAL